MTVLHHCQVHLALVSANYESIGRIGEMLPEEVSHWKEVLSTSLDYQHRLTTSCKAT